MKAYDVHKCLVEEAKKILKTEYGFLDNELSVEHSIKVNNKIFRVDLVGKNNKKYVGVECGNTLPIKLNAMKSVFNVVILIPYVIQQDDSLFCRKCNHIWDTRTEKPKSCPKCKSYFIYPNFKGFYKIIN
jgi:rubrerythrin